MRSIARQFGGPSGPAGHLVSGRREHDILTPDGHVALGYQLRRHMPSVAQRTFPREGFTVYDSGNQFAALLQQSGFTQPEVRVFGE